MYPVRGGASPLPAAGGGQGEGRQPGWTALSSSHGAFFRYTFDVFYVSDLVGVPIPLRRDKKYCQHRPFGHGGIGGAGG